MFESIMNLRLELEIHNVGFQRRYTKIQKTYPFWNSSNTWISWRYGNSSLQQCIFSDSKLQLGNHHLSMREFSTKKTIHEHWYQFTRSIFYRKIYYAGIKFAKWERYTSIFTRSTLKQTNRQPRGQNLNHMQCCWNCGFEIFVHLFHIIEFISILR